MSITGIHEMKKNIIYNQNIPVYFRNMLTYVRSLEFNERPNYFYLTEFAVKGDQTGVGWQVGSN